jgi:transposase
MFSAFKFRLYPTATQERLMTETIETCRLLYNDLLDDRIRTKSKAFEQEKALASFRHDNKKAGLEQARVEEQPLLVQRRRISKFAPVKQEAHEFIRE